jgi:hypothetical protein
MRCSDPHSPHREGSVHLEDTAFRKAVLLGFHRVFRPNRRRQCRIIDPVRKLVPKQPNCHLFTFNLC